MSYRTPPQVQAQKEARKRLILDTAAQLFAKDGFHNTSVKDIVEAAGISVGSFYFYFASKDELFDTLYHEMNDTYLTLLEMAAQRVMEDPALALCEAITHTLLLFCEQRDVARILLTDLPRHSPQQAERQQRSNQRFQYIVEQILAQMAQAGVLQVSSQKEAHVMAVSLMGGLYYAISVALDEASSTDDLLAYAYPLTLYNLRALAIAHDAQAVHATICRIIKEGSKP